MSCALSVVHINKMMNFPYCFDNCDCHWRIKPEELKKKLFLSASFQIKPECHMSNKLVVVQKLVEPVHLPCQNPNTSVSHTLQESF